MSLVIQTEQISSLINYLLVKLKPLKPFSLGTNMLSNQIKKNNILEILVVVNITVTQTNQQTATLERMT